MIGGAASLVRGRRESASVGAGWDGLVLLGHERARMGCEHGRARPCTTRPRVLLGRAKGGRRRSRPELPFSFFFFKNVK
jgi:hypothetical protein